jgi:serine/threonine-protein kinase
MPSARAAAERALQLDPSLADAHTTLGAVRALFDWDWAGSDDAFQRARALSPTYSTAVQWHAMQNALPRGRFAEAGSTIRRALMLDPLSPVVAASAGVVEHLSGNPSDAVATLRRVADVHPAFAMAHYFLGAALRDAGDIEGSVAAYETAIERSGATPEMIAGLAQSLALRGDAGEARRHCEHLEGLQASRHVSPCLLAQTYAALGETDAAIASLERALELRDPELVFTGIRRSYDPLRGAERFEAIRRQVAV